MIYSTLTFVVLTSLEPTSFGGGLSLRGAMEIVQIETEKARRDKIDEKQVRRILPHPPPPPPSSDAGTFMRIKKILQVLLSMAFLKGVMGMVQIAVDKERRNKVDKKKHMLGYFANWTSPLPAWKSSAYSSVIRKKNDLSVTFFYYKRGGNGLRRP